MYVSNLSSRKINEISCEKAGVNLGLGENGWLNLIRLGSQHMEFPTDNMSTNT